MARRDALREFLLLAVMPVFFLTGLDEMGRGP
jgi:hypothetical protein